MRNRIRSLITHLQGLEYISDSRVSSQIRNVIAHELKPGRGTV